MPNDELMWILVLKQLIEAKLDTKSISKQLIERGILQKDVDFNGTCIGDLNEILKRYSHLAHDTLSTVLKDISFPKVRLLNLNTLITNYANHYEKLTTTQIHTNSIYCLSYDQSGTRLISGSDDNLVKILALGVLQTTIRGHLNRNEGFVLDVNISKDNQMMVTAGSDRTVRCWSLDGYQLSCHHIGKEIVSIEISPCGKVLLVCCADGKVRAFGQANTGFDNEAIILEASTLSKDEVTSISVHPSSKRFICGSEDGNVYLFATKKLQFSRKNAELPRKSKKMSRPKEKLPVNIVPCMVFESHMAPLTDICFSPDGDRFVSVCKGGVICLYSITTGGFSRFEATINPPKNYIPLSSLTDSKLEFSNVSFNGDGSRIFAIAENFIYQYDGYTLERLDTLIFHSMPITIMCQNPVYPNQMLSADTAGNVIISSNGKVIFEHQIFDVVLSGAFSPCGEQFAIGDYKGCVHIFGPPDERYKDVPSQQFFESDFSKVRDDSFGILWDETTSELANPSSGDIVSMQRVAHPISQHMKDAKASVKSTNRLVERILYSRDRSRQLDNSLWNSVDERIAVLDRKHMRRRRMMIDIEPDPSRQRTSGQYVEVTNADILNNVPFDIPISSGDEYDGGEDEAELLPDFDEQEQSILALDESSGSEEADFLPSTETLGRTAPSKRTRETNNLRTVDAVNEILSASTSNATTTDDNESCDSRPRRKKIKRSIIETLMSDEGSHSSLEEDLLLTSKAEDISLPQAALLAIVRTTVSPWLQVTGPKSRPFLPQLKDLVIYCRKGHEEFASMVTDYPMIVDNTLPDILLARVISMKYFISGTEVICSIKLGIFPTMEPTEIPDSKLSSLVIEILYRPELEDFLALWVDYEFSSSNYFSVGDSCAAFVLGKEVFGNLINIKRGPSLWKKYSIQDVDGHVFEVSPWAIRNVNDDFAPYPSIPSTEKDRILPILQEFMETEHLATFADEIPYEEVPTYLDLVAYPVWAKLIHSRIVSGYYRSVAQVGFEWDLLCKNVNTFNKRGSLICQLCKSDVAPFKQRLIGSNSMGTLLTVPKVEFKPDEFEDFDEDEENEDDFSAFSEETDADEGTNIERVGKLKKSRRKSKRSRKSEKDLDEHYEFMSDGGDEDILDFPSSPPRSTRSTRHTSPSRQSRKNSPSRQPRSARHVSRSQEVLQQSTSEAGRLKEQKKRIGKGSKTNAYTNADDMGPSSRLPARIQAQTKRKFSEVDLKRIIGDSSDDSYAADMTDKRINRFSSKIQPKRKRKPKGFGESESEDMQDSSSSYRS